MNNRSTRRGQGRPLELALFAGVLLCARPAYTQYTADTFVVRLPRAAAAASPADALGNADVGDRFCNALHCVVFTGHSGTQAKIENLRALETRGAITLEALPDAHKVFFRSAAYDAKSGTFSRDFPGRLEVRRTSELEMAVVVFKSYPVREWTAALEGAGLTVLEPVQTMGFYVYGARSVIEALPALYPFVYGVVELPAGVKRSNLDVRYPGDDDAPALTTVSFVREPRDVVLGALRAIDPNGPWLAWQAGSLEAYSARISRADAMALSLFPEVLSVYRDTMPGGPSDERSNRIIATGHHGGSSWATLIGDNTGTPHFWDAYLANLSNLGMDLSHQVIGFVDTGVDSGLKDNSGNDYCPPYLRPPDYDPDHPLDHCRLAFTTDLSVNYNVPSNLSKRSDDHLSHGTLITAIAAGFSGAYSSGRDTQGYAFTQGVAQGARVAMSQFQLGTCDHNPRAIGEASPDGFVIDGGWAQKWRYSLVELGSTTSLPDGGTGPGAQIYNHSWNFAPPVVEHDPPEEDEVQIYEDVAIVLDRTTRSLHNTHFTFGGPQIFFGAYLPALHVISAGNVGDYPSGYVVVPPGAAKNSITVGTSETYNQLTYTQDENDYPRECGENDAGLADSPDQIVWFSSTGYPNLRLKPDLVAPGTRAYGRRSAKIVVTCSECNQDLDDSGQYAWRAGTSFAAPVVTGAAALTKEWLRTLGFTDASPALVKATLIATARSLTDKPSCAFCEDEERCCAITDCGYLRPPPDKYQGWGRVALDRLFGATSNYFFYDQGTAFDTNGQSYTQTLAITDTERAINIALVWTERPSAVTSDPLINLLNDLDLKAEITVGGTTYTWYGNNYYTDPDSCDRDGHSLRDPATLTYDRKNNVERINIDPDDIPAGATQITVRVQAFSLTADGIQPNMKNSAPQQDFALMVENAHQ